MYPSQHHRQSVAPVFLLAMICFSLQTPADAAPILLNYSPSAKPGDIVFVQGDSFGGTPSVRANTNGGAWQPLSIVSSWNPAARGPACLTVQIPNDFPYGIYDIQVSDGSNWSQAATINQPVPNDLDMEKVIPGQSMRVFGRNLMVSGGTPSASFYDPATGLHTAAAINTSSSNAYQLSVTAPSTLVVGTSYTVYVNNGYAPSYGIAVPEVVTANRGTDVWGLGVGWGGDFSATYHNIVSAPPPVGGGLDDAPNINAAISAARALGGGVVQLRPGVYNLSSTQGIGMYSDIVLNGWTGTGGTTAINYGSAIPTGHYDAIMFFYPNQTRMGLANVTLTDVDNRTSNNWISTLLSGSGTSKIFLKNVTLNLGLSQGPSMGGIIDFAVENCTITQGFTASDGPPLSIGASYATYTHNSFSWGEGYLVFGQSGATNTHVLIERNAFNHDLGWAAGWKGAVPHSGNLDMVRSNNSKILDNTFTLLNGPGPACNCGETILDENGGASDNAAGQATHATATTLTDSSSTFSLSPNANVVITSGTGMGQWRAISSASGDRLTVSQPWTVVPDSSSRYTILDWSAANWLVMGNTLTDELVGITLYASAAHDVSIVNNTLHDSQGIFLRPDQRLANTPPTFHVIWDTLVVGNTVVDDGLNSPRPAFIQILADEVSEDKTWGVGALGVEIRNNNVVGFGGSNTSEGIFSGGFLEGSSYTDEHIPFVLGAILQNNTVEQSPNAYHLNTGSYANVIWDYTNNSDAVLLQDTDLPHTTHASTGTVTHGAQVIQAASGTLSVGTGDAGSYSQITGVNGGSTGGLFPLTIRYSQGNAGTTTFDLYVNGNFIQPVTFPATLTSAGSPSWNVFANVTVYVPLDAGSSNTIMLQNDASMGPLAIDQYSIGN